MTVQDTHTPTIPQPRTAPDDVPGGAPVGEFPWPEPWHHSRGARPRSEYWDVASAAWHSRGPIVPPRRRD